jgi:hypothetical protein
MRHNVFGRVARHPCFPACTDARRQAPDRQKKETGFDETILAACCDAWNAPMAKSGVIASIGTREWAQVRI